MSSVSKEARNLKDMQATEFIPGFHGKMIHTLSMTLAYWEIEKDASLPEHSHVHEQVVNMLTGEFEITVSGTVHHLKPGDVLVIESHQPHSGRAISDCTILDVFQPVREEYR